MATLADFTVPYKILRNPPPTIRGNSQGKTGTLNFLVGLSDVPAFVATLAGLPVTVDLPGGGSFTRIVPLQHPDYPEMLAIAFDSEAKGHPGPPPGPGQAYLGRMYSHSRVAVTFASVPFGLTGSQPYYTVQTEQGTSHATVPISAFRFADMTRLGGGGMHLDEVVYRVTTYLSPSPVTPSLRNLVGKVNTNTFLECPAGTVRLRGISTEFDQKLSGVVTYRKSFQLAYRSRPWNQVLRSSGAWETPVNSSTGETTYLAADLSPLLQ